MELDKYDLQNGLEFICGTWQVDFIINGFSDDLAHIPAAEWKSDDGKDFSCITYTFYEDHTMTMCDTVSGKEEKGTWEQTNYFEYHYTLNGFLEIPDGPFKKNAETLNVQYEALVFSIGFLGIGLKKIKDGTITKDPDIADIVPNSEDNSNNSIVGKYAVEKVMTMVGNKFGMFTKEETKFDLDKKLKSKKISKRDYSQTMDLFDSIIEFTADHKVLSWAKIPDGITDKMLKDAIESGEVKYVSDGFFCTEENEWKCVDEKFYYDTRQEREISGQKVSSWDELTEDENGYISFGSGFMMIKKI